jgi:hypothetical protein
MTWWERGGLQGTYQKRKKNLVLQNKNKKMPILTTSSLRSLKKKKKKQDATRSSSIVKEALHSGSIIDYKFQELLQHLEQGHSSTC